MGLFSSSWSHSRRSGGVERSAVGGREAGARGLVAGPGGLSSTGWPIGTGGDHSWQVLAARGWVTRVTGLSRTGMTRRRAEESRSRAWEAVERRLCRRGASFADGSAASRAVRGPSGRRAAVAEAEVRPCLRQAFGATRCGRRSWRRWNLALVVPLAAGVVAGCAGARVPAGPGGPDAVCVVDAPLAGGVAGHSGDGSGGALASGGQSGREQGGRALRVEPAGGAGRGVAPIVVGLRRGPRMPGTRRLPGRMRSGSCTRSSTRRW